LQQSRGFFATAELLVKPAERFKGDSVKGVDLFMWNRGEKVASTLGVKLTPPIKNM